ncbi:hypothetical protein LCGC14_1783680 [marine sediment metagenome]|uniref:Uncharacterized protein n=1 Tax=marine sediment metagenome TaxID=412755 RepID=A0A0F9GUR7_9ZZZZ
MKQEKWKDSRGIEWNIHHADLCEGDHCPFHNPSDHLLKDAPIHIRWDKGALVERICKHGVGHADPASVAYFHKQGEKWAGVHGCDGCCSSQGEK